MSLVVLGVIAVLCNLFSLGIVIDALITTRILVQFIGQIGAVALLRRRAPDMPRPYRMWLYPLPSLVALAGLDLHLRDDACARHSCRPWRSRPWNRVLWSVVVARAGMAVPPASAGRDAIGHRCDVEDRLHAGAVYTCRIEADTGNAGLFNAP